MPSQKRTPSSDYWKTLLVFACFVAALIFIAWITIASPASSPGSTGSSLSLRTPETNPSGENQSVQQKIKELPESLNAYFSLTSTRPATGERALKEIKEQWHPGSTTMLIEIARYCRNRDTLKKLFELADSQTGNKFENNVKKWRQWIWKQEYNPHPDYAEFKKHLYGKIDQRFEEYFEALGDPTIRLDEIRWGGVVRDGIPPLKNPEMIAAGKASFLEDSNVVFGIVINGDARCYPKRILAWHEMFKDTIGGQSVAGVY